MNDLKISVITAVKNSVSTILSCLESVRNQNDVIYEHVIIDGMSADGTKEVLSDYLNNQTLIIREPDFGIYDAMNKGIVNSKGDIIGFLNADDFYANNNILFSIKKMFQEDTLLEACYADVIYVDKIETLKVQRYWKSNNFNYSLFSKGWSPAHPTFFARRSVYERYGNFNNKYQIAADVELMLRFLQIYKIKTKYVPEVWVKMRLGGISNKNLKNIFIQNQEVIRALKSHGIKVNLISFFFCKLLVRLSQYFNK
jgi:glycosyltransferase involved in cell wall biosynthesis